MIDSIKKAFALSPKALQAFYILAAFNVLVALLSIAIVPAPAAAPANQEMSLGRSLVVILYTVLIFVITAFVTAGVVTYARDLIKTGTANIADAISNAKKYYLSFLGLIALIIAVFIFLSIVLTALTAPFPAMIRALLMILVFVPLTVLIVMSPYHLIARDAKVFDSFKASIEMAKKRFLKILGLMAIIFVIALVVWIVASFFAGVLSLAFKPMQRLLTGVIFAVVNAAISVFVNITYMGFYLKNSEIESVNQ